MLSKIKSCGLLGIDGYIVEVETDISGSMRGFEKLGNIITTQRMADLSHFFI